jgi:hypothetical protein
METEGTPPHTCSWKPTLDASSYVQLEADSHKGQHSFGVRLALAEYGLASADCWILRSLPILCDAA